MTSGSWVGRSVGTGEGVLVGKLVGVGGTVAAGAAVNTIAGPVASGGAVEMSVGCSLTETPAERPKNVWSPAIR
jgi:hypothetical protein